jgi:hypothetical protein
MDPSHDSSGSRRSRQDGGFVQWRPRTYGTAGNARLVLDGEDTAFRRGSRRNERGREGQPLRYGPQTVQNLPNPAAQRIRSERLFQEVRPWIEDPVMDGPLSRRDRSNAGWLCAAGCTRATTNESILIAVAPTRTSRTPLVPCVKMRPRLSGPDPPTASSYPSPSPWPRPLASRAERSGPCRRWHRRSPRRCPPCRQS